MNTAQLPFEVTDPEGLAFDDSPQEFVNLSASPIVFTVRGISYFKPRFNHIGVNLAALNTSDDFARAYSRWMGVERALLRDRVASRAAQETTDGHYSILNALWSGDLDEAERIADKIDRKANTVLRVVGGNTHGS